MWHWSDISNSLRSHCLHQWLVPTVCWGEVVDGPVQPLWLVMFCWASLIGQNMWEALTIPSDAARLSAGASTNQQESLVQWQGLHPSSTFPTADTERIKKKYKYETTFARPVRLRAMKQKHPGNEAKDFPGTSMSQRCMWRSGDRALFHTEINSFVTKFIFFFLIKPIWTKKEPWAVDDTKWDSSRYQNAIKLEPLLKASTPDPLRMH